ncbi:MAG: hypothetical protein MHPSP_003710, partial [Paramarteilia canceri]
MKRILANKKTKVPNVNTNRSFSAPNRLKLGLSGSQSFGKYHELINAKFELENKNNKLILKELFSEQGNECENIISTEKCYQIITRYQTILKDMLF